MAVYNLTLSNFNCRYCKSRLWKLEEPIYGCNYHCQTCQHVTGPALPAIVPGIVCPERPNDVKAFTVHIHLEQVSQDIILGPEGGQ